MSESTSANTYWTLSQSKYTGWNYWWWTSIYHSELVSLNAATVWTSIRWIEQHNKAMTIRRMQNGARIATIQLTKVNWRQIKATSNLFLSQSWHQRRPDWPVLTPIALTIQSFQMTRLLLKLHLQFVGISEDLLIFFGHKRRVVFGDLQLLQSRQKSQSNIKPSHHNNLDRSTNKQTFVFIMGKNLSSFFLSNPSWPLEDVP